VSGHDKNLDLHLIHNIGYGPPLTNGEGPIVWNEAILDEHWDQLEDALSGNELVTNICGIKIENVEMTKERLAALVAILISGRATNSSTYVTFGNANLCAEGIISLSKLVEVSSDLQFVCLEHNRIDNMESACCLSRALKSHTVIDQLYLSHCNLGSSPEVLSVILQADVNRIILEHNNIDSLGAVKIAEYLEGDPSMQSIDLDHNRLNDDDAILISHALKRNTNLHRIYLRLNNLTSTGVKALLTCVFDNSSLNAISESNHNLIEMNIYTYSSDNSCLQDCIDRLLELDRMQKIMLALQDKDSLLQYLENVPVKLMPEVLAFPLRQVDHHRQYRNLNILYSTMRWWNMPVLYVYHNCDKSD
jgi:Ran GTPase-activating protein (RanGAP) involved in mRNA processing and transport